MDRLHMEAYLATIYQRGYEAGYRDGTKSTPGTIKMPPNPQVQKGQAPGQ